MELCTAGDLEELMKAHPGAVLPATDLPALVWQMAFSLFVGREQHRLRHYDVKLLNFFASHVGGGGGGTQQQPADASAGHEAAVVPVSACAVMEYEFADRVVRLELPPARAYMVKLADYGTADTSAETLGARLTAQQFGAKGSSYVLCARCSSLVRRAAVMCCAHGAAVWCEGQQLCAVRTVQQFGANDVCALRTVQCVLCT